MNVENFKEQDHAILASWLVAWDWAVLPLHALPATGLVVSDDGIALCMGFLYTTDSSISWLEWVVGNPTVGSIKRRPAVRKLLTALIQEAKTRGAKAVFTSVKHPKLMELYEEQGFLKTDREMTNMILGGL